MTNAPQAPINVTAELRRLSQTLNSLEGTFRTQREELRQRGMSLPPGTLSGLQQIRTDIDSITTQLDDSQTELQRLRALSRTAELINSTLDLDDVLNDVMDTVISLTAAERGYLMLRNPETGALEFRVARNIEQRSLGEGELVISSSIVAEVAHTGHPVVTTNAAQDSRFSSQKSVVSFALRSILCVPLVLKDTITGVIYADNRIKAGLFGDKELQLLYAFANQAAVAIENAQLFERLQASLSEITVMKDLLANIFASIASGVITTDSADLVLTLNKAASRILSVHEQGSLGQPVWNVLPPLYEGFDVLLQQVRQNQWQRTIEIESEVPQRGVVNLNLKLSPLRTDQQVTEGVAIVVDDLTELKQREEQLNLLRRYLPPPMVDNIESIDKLGLGGERRIVTTIFVDVRGFSTFPRSLRPQELMEQLNVYLTIASDTISHQNGIIDKYMANEIMGLFNTQLNPDDNHAQQAILAALKLADEYTEFYKQSHEPPDTAYYRVGIHTGVATLGNVGSETRKEFTAIGDSINLAHRLLENALPGQIIISEDVYQDCYNFLNNPENRIQVIPGEQIQVKGRRQATKIYQVRRA